MEEEAEKLKELQNEVEKQMNLSPPPGVSQEFHMCTFEMNQSELLSLLPRAVGPVIMSIEEKMEADARSIYVGNVSKRSNSFRCEQRGWRWRVCSSN